MSNTRPERGPGAVRFGSSCAIMLAAIVLMMLAMSGVARAAACYEVSITKPTPFMGNNGEIVQLSDGSVWEIKYEYHYMYEYYPDAVICPGSSKLIVKGKSLNVALVAAPRTASPAPSPATPARPSSLITVVYVASGCDYFIADGPQGYYLLEWYGGHSPSKGDAIAGQIASYGFKDIYYVNARSNGRVWVEDYLLSRDRAAEEYAEKCN